LADLQLKTAESEFEYLPTKRKQSEKKFDLDIKQTKAITEKAEYEMGQLKTEDEAKQYIVNQEKIGKHLNAANQLKTNKDKRAYLNRYRKEILAAGDDKEDDAFKAVMNMSGDQFNQSFGLVMQGNKYLQGLAEKRFGKSTSLQNYTTGKTKTVLFNDPNYQQKVDDSLSGGFTVIKTPGLEMKGTAGQLGLGDKVLNREMVNEETAIRSANFIGKRTIEALMENPEALAVTGAFARVATSLNSQIKSTAKLMGVKWKEGTSFDSQSYENIFQDAGISNVVIRGNLTQLARMLATASGESKVLSDPDMRRWLNVVAVGNGDPKIVSAAIRNALEIQNYKFKDKYRLAYKRQYEGDLGYPKKPEPIDLEGLKAKRAALIQEIQRMKDGDGTQ